MRSAETIDSRSCMALTAAGISGTGSRPKPGDEARRAQHPQRVVAERDLGRQRRAQPAGGEVGQPVEGVDELEVGEAQRHGVDGEVAPRQVDLDGVAERHLGLARVGRVDLGPVGGDLEGPGRPCVSPTVPKRLPWSHTASAQPFTSRSTSSGRASVVRSRSLRPAGGTSPAKASRTEPPDHVEAAPGLLEPARPARRWPRPGAGSARGSPASRVVRR